ncbi:MAG: DUF4179 domain-containing protein [Bacilli bacterium]
METEHYVLKWYEEIRVPDDLEQFIKQPQLPKKKNLYRNYMIFVAAILMFVIGTTITSYIADKKAPFTTKNFKELDYDYAVKTLKKEQYFQTVNKKVQSKRKKVDIQGIVSDGRFVALFVKNSTPNEEIMLGEGRLIEVLSNKKNEYIYMFTIPNEPDILRFTIAEQTVEIVPDRDKMMPYYISYNINGQRIYEISTQSVEVVIRSISHNVLGTVILFDEINPKNNIRFDNNDFSMDKKEMIYYTFDFVHPSVRDTNARNRRYEEKIWNGIRHTLYIYHENTREEEIKSGAIKIQIKENGEISNSQTNNIMFIEEGSK